MNFQAKDKIKRIKMAKDLFTKGFSIERLASYFEVSTETINGYLAHDIIHDGNKEIVIKKEVPITTLTDFALKTTTMDRALPTMPKEGDACAICKEYGKYKYMKKWKDDVYICKTCYSSLDRDKIRLLNNI